MFVTWHSENFQEKMSSNQIYVNSGWRYTHVTLSKNFECVLLCNVYQHR